MSDRTALHEALGHAFADPALLTTALTHRSYAHEHGGQNNERLEFLGDAVLSACVASMLVERFPAAVEGQLSALRTRLVNTDAVAAIGVRIGLGEAQRLGRGEQATGGRTKPKLLCGATEAVLGAVFIDAGFEKCRAIVASWMTPALDAGDMVVGWKDAKSRLQELSQERWRLTPRYDVLSEEGPDHAKSFEVAVFVGDRRLAVARGRSRHEGEKKAAEAALADESALPARTS